MVPFAVTYQKGRPGESWHVRAGQRSQFGDSRLRRSWVWRLAVSVVVGEARPPGPTLTDEAVSRLFERGLHRMEVAAISGHKTLAMLKRYTHYRAARLAEKLG